MTLIPRTNSCDSRFMRLTSSAWLLASPPARTSRSSSSRQSSVRSQRYGFSESCERCRYDDLVTCFRQLAGPDVSEVAHDGAHGQQVTANTIDALCRSAGHD